MALGDQRAVVMLSARRGPRYALQGFVGGHLLARTLRAGTRADSLMSL